MAMLAIIHRSVLGLGPSQFSEYFKRASASTNPMGRECQRRHNRQLESHRRGKFLDILANSALGLVDVYNLLPSHIVEANSVKVFQTRLQDALRNAAKSGAVDWEEWYSPRRAVYAHPLRNTNGALPSNAKIGIAPTIATKNTVCMNGWLSFGQ